MLFLEKADIELFRREDYYFAQLTAEVRRSWVKDKTKISLEDFLMKFSKKKDQTEPSPESKQDNTLRSKQFWLGNILRKKKSKKKVR